ncbi:hydrolase [Mycobacterium sp. 852002-51163_SCH5372311]|uniref:adenylate/guanylate cyclase domain-containing protein n=1 Tax=Mycobacterium sp. 852002-51163_SCH5372311 TaxID=1834097 RepID=UPI0007FC3E4F|nr:adenylate/guanylate cyclase domain-containing protein [Mycobacterium sp. 852002-51163_SCH5372311]OBF79742.1 hydrolase [Mycobacterium sp. 852002-51163_SCH5372311]
MSDGRVRYARNGDVRLAYRVFGEGEPTLVWVPGWVSNVDLYDDPTTPFAPLVAHLARRTRLVVWDKRGTGLSDPVTRIPPLDERMDDLNAVLEAVDAGRPALLGISEGGPMSVLFAATYPERVRSMVLYGTAARFVREPPHFPWGLPASQIEAGVADIDEHWGEGFLAKALLGDAAHSPGVREMLGKMERACASPTIAQKLWRSLGQIDVGDILKSVQTPTLVLSRPGDRMVPIDSSRALASAIPGAVFRALPPGAHAAFDIDDSLAAETLAFVCGDTASAVNERVLMTVLFTDIVGSSEQVVASGDRRWCHQLDAHDELVDALLARYGGRRAKHTGDGIFAHFDGPTKAARCALELVPALATRGIRIRAGVHTGEVERRGDEWSGRAVHIGARLGAMAGADEVLTSRTVRDLSAGSGLRFESLGVRHMKGLDEETEVFRVTAQMGALF